MRCYLVSGPPWFSGRRYPILGGGSSICSHRTWPLALLMALGVLVVWALPAFAEGGVIEGRLSNGTAAATLPAGLQVTLEKLAADGTSTTAQQAKAEVDGAFRFAAVDGTAGYTYTVSTKYQDVIYRSEPVAFQTAGLPKPVQLAVYETTDSDAAIGVDLAHAVLQPDQQSQGLWAIEVLVLNNSGDRTYVGNPQQTINGKRPTLRFSLPPGAHEPQPMQGLDPAGILKIVNGFADTAPMPPGQRSIAYSYLVPSDAKDMTYSRALDYPTKRFAVLMADTGGRIEAARLTQGEPAEMGGQRYQTFIGEGLLAGDSVAVRLSGAAAAAGSSVDPTIIVGGVAVLAIIAGILVYLRKRGQVVVVPPALEPDHARERLMAAIADLDDAYEAGEIEEDEYRAKRAARKKRLAKLMQAQAEG